MQSHKQLLLYKPFFIFCLFACHQPFTHSTAEMKEQTNAESPAGEGDALGGSSGTVHGSSPDGSWSYGWEWGSTPGRRWGYAYGSGHSQTPSGDGEGFGFGSGYGSGSGSSYGFGSGGGGGSSSGQASRGAYGYGGGYSGPDGGFGGGVGGPGGDFSAGGDSRIHGNRRFTQPSDGN